MAQPNQFTRAEETGQEKPKGANQFTTGKREKLDPATIDKLRADKAAKALEKILEDQESTKEQITAAAKALLPYGKSTYASIIEQQLENPVDESETAAQLAHIIASNPAILAPLVQADPGVRAALQAILSGKPEPVDRSETATNAVQQGVNAA